LDEIVLVLLLVLVLEKSLCQKSPRLSSGVFLRMPAMESGGFTPVLRRKVKI